MKNDTNRLKDFLSIARNEISKVIIGQQEAVDMSLIAIFTGNHVLVEGVPGVAKTLLVRTFAALLGCDYNRIQFTPDLMPTDITGTNVFNMSTNEFSLLKGPVFTTFLLADEINRAPAKTQSAMLQVMQERAVSIDRKTYRLSPNFTVFATQNPIEYEGTYPLPEALKDRFMLKINMDYLSMKEEFMLATSMLGDSAPEAVLEKGIVKAAIDINELQSLRKSLEDIVIKKELIKYIVEIVTMTRKHDSLLVGAGPRATQALVLGSRAYAALENRDYVTPDDVKRMAAPVLEHRLILKPDYEIEGMSIGEAIDDILKKVNIPR
jgi:MoxR-like ATPase